MEMNTTESQNLCRGADAGNNEEQQMVGPVNTFFKGQSVFCYSREVKKITLDDVERLWESLLIIHLEMGQKESI